MSFSKILQTSVAILLSFGFSQASATNVETGIVTIYSEESGAIGSSGSGQGTGFFISPEGDILTAYHVVDGSTKLTVYNQRGDPSESVWLIATDPQHDLAIIRAKGFGKAPYFRTSNRELSPSDEVRVVGSPRGMPSQTLYGRPTATGAISSIRFSDASGSSIFNKGIDVLPLDVTIYNGISGAPVLNDKSAVVGVLSGSFDEGRGIAWAIPIKYLDTMERFDPIEISATTAWPEFDLMSSSWRSLKRSYEETFSPAEIQKLEVLEYINPIVTGNWVADVTNHIDLTTALPWFTCRLFHRKRTSFSFDKLERQSTRLVGRLSIQMESWTEFAVKPPGTKDDYMTKLTRENCLADAGGDGVVRQFHLSGSVFGLVYRGERGQLSNDVVKVEGYITDCSPDCPGRMYGERDIGAFDIVSDSILTLGNTVAKRP